MTPQQLRLIEARPEIDAAFEILRVHKIPFTQTYKEFEAMLNAARREPTEDDRRWPLTEPTGIQVHLIEEGGPEERPLFGTGLAIGRAYALSSAQRNVIREWFNMTPAPLVEVIDLATFDGKVVKHVVLRSMEHIDPRRRKVMNKFTLDQWGKFMSAVVAEEARIKSQKELERYIGRIVRLLEAAKAEGVQHNQRTPRPLAVKLHTEVETRKLTEPQEIRDLLRSILISEHEHELAKLVKEPKYWSDRDEPAARRLKTLEMLENEYGL